ncbi:SH3 domain-containing protein, partial [Marinovum algicola]|uniref:SH3 domain-containing protein n=1 Tax=Marinovum algicola TaxID=42444 RepID=UPI0024B8E5FD
RPTQEPCFPTRSSLVCTADAVALAVAEAVTGLPGQDAAPRDLRSVNGSRVNLRDGPGTGFGVLGTLARGTEVEVLEDPGAGWVRLQVVPEGQIGWIADFLLDGA